MAAVLLGSASASAQSLSVQSVEAEKDGQTELVVSVEGATGRTALQFNLSLPSCVSVTDNGSNYGATLGAAANGHTLRVETLSSGDKLFVIYNMDNNTFANGELLRLPLTAGSEPATGNGRLYTVRTASADAVSHTGTDASFTVTVTESEETILQNAYQAAMAAITDGNYYQIFTEVEGSKYYLTNTGTLTADADAAYSFHFSAVNYSGTLYETGWNVGVPFTNPSLTGGSTGDIVNVGNIRTDNNNRNDWERQVFFLKDGKYAVRSTNANSANWGANTYWDMTGTTEQPEAGYNLAPQFIWQLNDLTGAAILAEARAIIEAKEGVGDGLFLIPEDALATLADAVDAAAAVIESSTSTSAAKAQAIDNLRAAIETYLNTPVAAPDPATAYTFQQKASELFLGLSESGVSLATKSNASELFFEADENGGYFIHDAEGQYVGFEGSNNWTMSTSADKKYEWKVTVIGDGYYTLSKLSNANHHVGTNDNDVAEGAPCYADKNNSDNSYYLWKIEEVEEEAPIIEIAFERVAGKAYTGDDVPYDEAAILEALGAASWDEITTMYPMVMTTGEAGEDHDGWRNVDGDPAEWNGEGTDLGLCLKYPHDGAFALCTHPGNDPVVGTEMSAAWILGTDAGKTVVVKVNVTFIEPEVIDLTFDKLNKLDEVAVDFKSDTGAYYEGMTSDVDVAAILEKLGVESLSDVTIYAVKSDGSLDDNYKLGTSDGWRDANGDWKVWTNDIETAPYFYVKADFSKADTQIYEVGGYPGQTDEPAVYTATYTFVKTGTANAVVLKVNLTYNIPIGIADVNAGLNESKVHKVLSDGKIVIIKGDKEYYVNGATIK